jgi:outer membrane protein assembly factor BamD (BamD/ComL family)
MKKGKQKMNKRKLICSIAIVVGLVVLIAGCSKKTELELLQEAQKAFAENKYNEVINIYNQLLKVYPRSQNAPKVYFDLGAIYLVHLDDQKTAEKVWNRVQKKYPEFDIEKEFFDYAQKLQDEGKPEWAIKFYDQILSLLPESAHRDKALFLKGFVYSEELNEQDKARETFKKFMEEYPNSELKDDAEYMLENMGKEPEWGK